MSDTEAVKSRSKNFSENEIKIFLSACDKFHDIINKNSSRDADKVAKVKAWESIKTGFERYCKADGFFVSKNWMCFFMNIIFVRNMLFKKW